MVFEYRPRLAVPKPLSLLNVISSALSDDDDSPVPVLQPACSTENLRSVACGKNVADGIATTSVGMPPRVHICAIACAILASLT